MEELVQRKYKYISFADDTGLHDHSPFDSETLITYIERWKNIREIGEKGIEVLQTDLEKLRKEQHDLSGMSIKDLLKAFPVNKVLSENVQRNKCLVFLLRRGYIDEKYVNYINYFKGTSITKDDMNFILAVKNHTFLEFDYHLTKTPMVIERLQIYEFEQRNIYNFDLLEQLLEMQESEKLKIFIKQLAIGDDISWRFIDEFISWTAQGTLFIRLLAENWAGMWAHISADETLTYERKLMYLQMILSVSECSTIESLNINQCMTRYFENHIDILQRLADCDGNKVISAIACLNVKFSSLEIDNVPAIVLDSVFEKRNYILNEDMLRTAITYRNKDLSDEFERKPYSTLILLKDLNVLGYVRDNIEYFVDKIVLSHNDLYDNPEDIVDMLIQLAQRTEMQVKLIEQENFCFNSINDCCLDYVHVDKDKWMPVWDMLLRQNAVKVNWENVIAYWEVYYFSEALNEYISSHVDELVVLNNVFIDDRFKKAFIKEDFDLDIQFKLLPILRLENFDLEIHLIPEETLRIMVGCNYFEFTAERYWDVDTISTDIGINFIIQNQEKYMSLADTIHMSENLLEQLILRDDFSKYNSYKLFEEYAANYMTEKIAIQMKHLDLPVTKNIFMAAWRCTDAEEHVNLLLDYFTMLNRDELEQYFAETMMPYSELSDRSCRHYVILPITKENQALAKYLYEIKYITSYGEVDFGQQEKECKKMSQGLRLNVKKVQ